MDEPTLSTSTCPGCSEDIVSDGTLNFKILPPPKQRRLSKSEARSRKQICEVTCSNCHTVIKYQFDKPPKSELFRPLKPSSDSASTSATPSIQELRRERKRKPGKDAHAGLIIPSSFAPSPFSMKRPSGGGPQHLHHQQPKRAKKPPDLSFLTAALNKSSSSSSSSGLDKFLK